MVIIKENKLNEAEYVKINLAYSNGHLKATIDINVRDAVENTDPWRRRRYGVDLVSGDDAINAAVKGLTRYINELKYIAQDDDFRLVSMVADNL